MMAPRIQVGLRNASRAAVILLGCGLAALQSAPAASLDAATLMGLIAAHPKGRVSFVETRHLSLLDTPLVSSGELLYTPPDRLERHSLEPREETAILDGDTLTLTRDGRTRTLSLADLPQVAVVIDSLRAVLSGDLDRLQRSYELLLAGTPDAWTLDLMPKDPRLPASLRRIHLVGTGGRVQGVDWIQTNGDRSSMQIGGPAP